MGDVFSIPLRSIHAFADGRRVAEIAKVREPPAGMGSRFLLNRYFADDRNWLLRNWCQGEFLECEGIWPLVLSGPSGCGKSALAETLASQIADRHHRDPDRGTHPVAAKINGNDFRRHLLDSINTKSVSEFRRRLSQPRVLVIDDLTAIGTDHAVQYEMVTWLDTLAANSVPVIITTPIVPWADDKLSHQLRSRLSAGLSIEITTPGKFARREIIRQLSRRLNVSLDDSSQEWLSESASKSVPMIAHQLNQIALQAADCETENLGVSQIKSWINPRGSAQLPTALGLLSKLVARQFELDVASLRGKSRRQCTVLARAVMIYLAKTQLSLTFAQIAEFLHRDQSTIRHAFGNIKSKIQADSQLLQTTNQLGKAYQYQMELTPRVTDIDHESVRENLRENLSVTC